MGRFQPLRQLDGARAGVDLPQNTKQVSAANVAGEKRAYGRRDEVLDR